MPTIHDEAICVRQWDWSETSQTVSLFAREAGVFRAVAKGSRREGAPFSGGLEVLTRAGLTASLKRTGALSTLTSWDLRDPYPALRRELQRFHAGLYVADLVHHALRDDDPHPRLYDACVVALATIGGSLDTPAGDPGRALLRFQWALQLETGRAPVLDAAADSGRDLDRAPTYLFDPELGGLVPDPGAAPARGWRVREQTVTLLRALAAGGSADWESEVVGRANRLLAAHIAWGLDTTLPTATLALGRSPQPPSDGGNS
ncbi:MAG: DNA repair protein RecO [Phycisphaerales bacterium JB059]